MGAIMKQKTGIGFDATIGGGGFCRVRGVFTFTPQIGRFIVSGANEKMLYNGAGIIVLNILSGSDIHVMRGVIG